MSNRQDIYKTIKKTEIIDKLGVERLCERYSVEELEKLRSELSHTCKEVGEADIFLKNSIMNICIRRLRKLEEAIRRVKTPRVGVEFGGSRECYEGEVFDTPCRVENISIFPARVELFCRASEGLAILGQERVKVELNAHEAQLVVFKIKAAKPGEWQLSVEAKADFEGGATDCKTAGPVSVTVHPAPRLRVSAEKVSVVAGEQASFCITLENESSLLCDAELSAAGERGLGVQVYPRQVQLVPGGQAQVEARVGPLATP